MIRLLAELATVSVFPIKLELTHMIVTPKQKAEEKILQSISFSLEQPSCVDDFGG